MSPMIIAWLNGVKFTFYVSHSYIITVTLYIYVKVLQIDFIFKTCIAKFKNARLIQCESFTLPVPLRLLVAVSSSLLSLSMCIGR